MRKGVEAGFRGAMKALESELPLRPLSRWNESVFRYFRRADRER